ncbi:MAG TPA: ATP-binding protein [Candidatus Binatia bacterium]|jgi:signal transduction histidine kinase
MKLGTKLILFLVATSVVIMSVHGYWSIEQDRKNTLREMRVGMIGLSHSIQAALRYIYSAERDIVATQRFIDSIGRSGNIHGVVVYDITARPIATSASLTGTAGDPALDPQPVLDIDPKPVLASGKAIDGYIESRAHPVYYRIEPILDSNNSLVGAFVLGRRGASYNLTLETRRNRIILTTAVLIAILSFVIFFMVRRSLTRPIKQLISGIREIGEGNWEKRLDVEGQNEISSLAVEFNQMCHRLEELYRKLIQEQRERLNLERSLRQSDKLASVGQLAAGLAHEIGTPLNIIGGRAEFLLRRPRAQKEVNDNLQTIRSQIDRIAGIVRQLLEFSRRREPAFRRVEPLSLLEKVIRLLEHKIAEKNVMIDFEVDKSLPFISADADQLQQVFLNLLLNSLQALPYGGRIKISAAVALDGNEAASEKQSRLCIEFEDNGAGITHEHIGQVFDPFFTTKDIGEGTGLGLSVSYGIVKDHGGEIRVQSELGGFTRFSVFLPTDRQEDAVWEKRAATR